MYSKRAVLMSVIAVVVLTVSTAWAAAVVSASPIESAPVASAFGP